MTAGQSPEVDLDLLADYVGGALDGTPEQAVVERLIATTPQWRDTHQALVRAMDPVRDALAQWGAEQPTMPPDVAGRLTAALGAAGPVLVPGGRISPENATTSSRSDQHRPDQHRPERHPDQHRPDQHRSSVAGRDRPAGAGGRPGSRGATDRGSIAARRRRLARAATPAALGIAVVTLGLFGVTWLAANGGGQSDSGSSTADGGAAPAILPEQATDNAGGPNVLLDPAPERLLASGTDYTPTTLPGAVAALPQRATAAKELDSGSGGTPGSASTLGGDRTHRDGRAGAPVPAGLARLADPTALSTCLASVTGEHGHGQVTVQAVDYASFEGAPALIVVFVDAAGARWAWVSGSDCGLPGSAADTRHRVRVG